MPRSWTEFVSDWPALLATIWYLARVAAVDKTGEPPAIQVTLELLDHGQEGRRLDITLPLPVRPAGPTSEFFLAAGIGLRPKSRIRPKDTVSKSILVRFDTATNQPIEFMKPETPDERIHQTAQLISEAPSKQKQP